MLVFNNMIKSINLCRSFGCAKAPFFQNQSFEIESLSFDGCSDVFPLFIFRFSFCFGVESELGR